MSRRFVKTMFVTVLCCVMLALAVNADFAKTNTYSDGMFKDVKASHWFAESVKDAYEFGLMKGMGDGKFSPDGTLTVAEGLTIASRIHQTLNGTTIPTSEGAWYQTYVDYAKNSGFMRDGQFDSYTREIKRYEMASLLADVCKDLPAINTIGLIPDVSVTEPYEQKVLTLYRSGILTGNDDYGTFMPFSNLKRSEISAMAVRIADSAKRVSKTFKVVPARTFTDAYGIAEVPSGGGRYGIANSWKYDNRFDFTNYTGTPSKYLTDTSDTAHMAIIRDFGEENDGIVTMDLSLQLTGSDHGSYIVFRTPDEKDVVRITPQNGKLAIIGEETIVSELDVYADKITRYGIKFTLDLDKNTAHAIINNIEVGTVKIPDLSVSRLQIGTNKMGTGYVNFEYMKMYKNYILCEHFVGSNAYFIGKPLTGWDEAGFVLQQMMSGGGGYDSFSPKTETAAGAVSSASKTFEPTTGKIYFQTFVLLPEKTDGASVALQSAGKDVFRFETKNGKFVCNGKELYDYLDNVWYLLSLEADTATGMAVIKINGKEKATLKFAEKYFDSVSINFAPANDAVMWFDDVELYPLIEHYDYPSYPKVAESKDYNIGINVCYLWRDSNSGEGWDACSAFPEFDTYLGYYDEGLRETADWETKWMSEHGIDFMHVCWYPPNDNQNVPIKKMTRSYEPLHDGYMNSKYSDLVDFCIMWENGSNGIDGLENFKEYIWKYWREYYFADDRYARLDNKAVISIWSKATLLKSFGSEEGIKEAVDFMDAELKKMGYDGLILLFAVQNGDTTKAAFETNKAYGAEGVYGYHWNTKGYDADYQISCMKKLRNTADGIQHIIPTVSVGFNSVGRHDDRYPIIDAAGHLKVCEFMKEELATYSTNTWRDNTLFISTWNEFSEGTYVFPTASTGWDLLENIRRTFTDGPDDHSDVDVLPTQAQKARVNRMYPDDYSALRRHRLETNDGTSDKDYSDLGIIASYDMVYDGADFWSNNHGISDYSTFGGVISGSSSQTDFSIISKSTFRQLKAEDTPVLHLRMKTEFATTGELFFITDTDSKWGNDKKIVFNLKNPGEYVDYYVDLSTHAKYTGTITAFRVDPMVAVGYFEISLIEFLGYTEEMLAALPSVAINGTKMEFDTDIVVTDDGDYAVPVVSYGKFSALFTALRLYHEWNRFDGDGVLTLKTYEDKEVVLNVGSDKAIVDGKETSLGFTVTLYDGVPVVELKKFCKVLGYKYTMNSGELRIQACTDTEYARLSEINSSVNTWGFNFDGIAEDWKLQNCTLVSVSGGFLKLSPTNADPAISHEVSFKASDYNTISVGVKYNDTMKLEGVEAPLMFFITETDSSYSRDKRIAGEYAFEEKTKDGIVPVYFYMPSNAKYAGNITGIRFDPYNKNTPFEVDYIRVENRTRRLTSAEKAELEKLANDDGFTQDKNMSFEFDNAADKSNWAFQHISGEITGGFFKFTPTTGRDLALTRKSASANCDDYKRVVVGIKYVKDQMEDAVPEFYFITEEDTAWNKTKLVKGQYVILDGVKNGDVIRAVFDLTTNEKFTGTLKNFRFDPYNKQIPFELDYIRFYK